MRLRSKRWALFLFIVLWANPAFAYNMATTNQSADVVVGQQNFTSATADQTGDGNEAANTLDDPTRVSSDGTRLIISDYNNHRVLVFNSIPTSNDASADIVIGQADFNSGGSGTAANRLNNPYNAWSDGTRLYVALESAPSPAMMVRRWEGEEKEEHQITRILRVPEDF